MSSLAVLALLGVLLVVPGTSQERQAKLPKGFALGADLSFANHAESHGWQFKEDGRPKKALDMFADHGMKWIRLRIFVEPVKEGLPNDLAYTLQMAKEAKQRGMKLLLDFHYAQSWADPGKQPTPDAWKSLTHEQLVQKVTDYTKETIAAFAAAKVMPEIVQIGNEVRPGMLWPKGRIPQNWDNFADYLKAGVKGVDQGRGKAKMPKIMIHNDEGGKVEGARWFYDGLTQRKVPFDIIGFSYYPFWHGTFADLKATLNDSADRYGKEVMVVETAFHWQPHDESKGQTMEFPETPEGQAEFFEKVIQTVLEVPKGRGTGVFWWEPATKGVCVTRSMMDFDGNVLPAIKVFGKYR